MTASPSPRLTTCRGRLWARRLKWIFRINITASVRCKGPIRIIARIEDPVVIEKILAHLRAKEGG